VCLCSCSVCACVCVRVCVCVLGMRYMRCTAVACHRSECVRDRERGRAKASEREGERVCVFARVKNEICSCSLPENRGCLCV